MTQLIWLKCQFWGFINIFFQYAVKETGKVGTTTAGWLHSSGLVWSIYLYSHSCNRWWVAVAQVGELPGGRRSEVCFLNHGLVPLSKMQNSRLFPMWHLQCVDWSFMCDFVKRKKLNIFKKNLTNLIVNRHGFKTVLLVCWNKTCFSVTLSVYVAAACEDFTPCHGLTESLDSQSDWRQWGEDERRRLKGNKKSKRGEGGDFYSLSSMIDVRSIVEGKGRRGGAEKSIREGEV